MAEKQRILIVDDDRSIAELISLYLEKECFSTRIAEDGEEAMKNSTLQAATTVGTTTESTPL